MVKIRFDNENVYVNYCNGQWYAQPLDNSWLWVIGAIRNGERIEITDNRRELQDHQYDLSCTRGLKETNFVMLRELLKVYTPKERGIMSPDEFDMINDMLHIKERTMIELRNLRDFVVESMGDSDEMVDWDRMSAITHCIDTELFNRGEEV